MTKIPFFTAYPISSLCLLVFIVSDRYLGSGIERQTNLINYDEAKSKCHTSSSNINKNSSRSHCICQFELIACQEQDQNQEDDSKSVSSYKSGFSTDDESISSEQGISNRSVMMQIVDLAGNERSKRTGAMTRSAAQKESSFINSSLMKLMRCFNSLQSNNRIIASSFRESKLTHLFMNHFLSASSASRTRMIKILILLLPALMKHSMFQIMQPLQRIFKLVSLIIITKQEQFKYATIIHDQQPPTYKMIINDTFAVMHTPRHFH